MTALPLAIAKNRYTTDHTSRVAAVRSGLTYGLIRQTPEEHGHINRYHLQDTVAQLLPQSRTAACQRYRTQGAGAITVLKTTSQCGHTGYRYGNIMSCGTPWICPNCAGKIAKFRHRELSQAIERAFARNWEVSLLTVTIQHDRQSDLATLFDDMQRVFAKFTGSRAWRAHKLATGIVGYARVLEIVDSPAGWHPHFHMLLFHQTTPMTESAYAALWQQACTASHVACPAIGAVDLRPVRDSGIAEYLCKDARLFVYGNVDDEVGGDAKARTIWGILADARLHNVTAIARFYEYAKATKGKRKLIWSRGLREALGLRPPKSDAQTVALQDEQVLVPVAAPPQLLGFLDLAQWKSICENGRRGEFLQDVRRHGWEAALTGLREYPQVHPRGKPPSKDARAVMRGE